MATIKPFLIVFFPAYVLFKILMSIFNVSCFSLDEPSLLAFVFDIIFWSLSWAVSFIVYVTIRDGIRTKQ